MKRIGIVFLGIGFGIVLYLIYSNFFIKKEMLSPIEDPQYSQVIKQNTKE